jgi:integrin alpha FG-GAP repeat containing protein 1
MFQHTGHLDLQAVSQLPQSGYQALGTPYSHFGLGRTNNYVERLFVGSSLTTDHYTILEALIPNSQLIINPPYPLNNGSTIEGRPVEWRSELFLHPGDWVPWVAAAVAGAVAVLGFVVLGLRAREQVSFFTLIAKEG